MGTTGFLRISSRSIHVPKVVFFLLIIQVGLSIGVLYLMYFDAPYYRTWPLVNLLTYCENSCLNCM